MPRVFISYSSRNRTAAVAVERALGSAGLDVWRDERRLENDWSAEIAQALAAAHLLCLLWSKEAAASRWVRNEWLTARALEKLIVPCLLPGAPELPPEIQNMQGVAFGGTPAGRRKVAKHVASRTKLDWRYDFRTPVKGYVPFAPDDDFIGRKDDLLSIYLGLVGQLNQVAVSHLGVVGMGGVGKTALAIEFAHRFGAAFDGVYWVQGQSLAQLLAELVRLARDRLRLAIDDPHGADANGRYLRALAAHASAHPQMLLIIDNVTEPESLVAGRFPPLGLGCNVLFTTRTAFTLTGVAGYTLEILRPEPALELLARRRPATTAPEAEAARDIANAVGYLPLALAMIASHLRKFPQVSYAHYLKTLRAGTLAAIDSTKIDPSELATRHEDAVGVTLRSQWSTLRDPAARLLLKVAAHLPEASVIPAARLGLLTGLADGESATALRLSRPLHLLRQLSLIGGGESAGAIRVHPLVAAVVQRLIPARARAGFLRAAALRLKKTYGDLTRLEAEHRSRGIDSVIEDLGAARAWAAADRDLRLLERLLDRERHHLRPPTDGKDETVPQPAPRFFQQLHLRAGLLGLPKLSARFLDAGRREGRAMVRLRASTAVDDVGLLRVYQAHEDAVVAVGMSHEARRLVTASMGGQIIVWDVVTGQIVRVLGGQAFSIDAAAVAPDGRRAFIAGWARGARRDEEALVGWDLETGERLWQDAGHEGAIAVLPGGTVILTGSSDGATLLCDAATSRRMARLEGPERSIAAAGVSLDGRRAITGTGRGVVSMWDLEANSLLYDFEIDPSSDNIRRGITAVGLTPDGRSAAIAAGYGGRETVDYFGPDREGRLFLWDLGERRVVRHFLGHTGPVNAVAFSGDGSRLLSGSSDKTLKLWDVHTGRCLRTLTGHTREVTSVALTADGRLAASGGWDANAILWDLGAAHRARPAIGHSLWVRSASIDDRGSIAATSSDDHSVILWNVETGKRTRVLEGHTDRVNRVALAPDGSRAVSGDQGGRLILWRTRTGRPVLSLDAKKGRIHAVGLSPDGRLVLSGSALSLVLVWDGDTGRLLQGFRHPEDEDVDNDSSDGVTSLVVSPDGQTATSADESSLKLYAWDLGAVAKHRDQILAADRMTQIALQKSLEKPLGVFTGHSRGVLAIDGDADGRRILSGSEDHTAIVWSVTDRRPLLRLEGHAQTVTGVAFASSDHAVTVSWDRTLVLWDLKSGQAMQRLFFDSQLFAIAARNGRIVAGDVGGGVYFLDITHGGRRA